MSGDPAPVTGVWLRKASAYNGGRLEVLVEVGGVWRRVIDDRADDGPISHIVEPAGIRKAPVDDLPDAPSPAEVVAARTSGGA